jgi:hypothetical protein
MSRDIVHLLRRDSSLQGETFSRGLIEVVEVVIRRPNVMVLLRLDYSIAEALLEPQGIALPFEKTNSELRFIVPEVSGYQMIVLKHL